MSPVQVANFVSEVAAMIEIGVAGCGSGDGLAAGRPSQRSRDLSSSFGRSSGVGFGLRRSKIPDLSMGVDSHSLRHASLQLTPGSDCSNLSSNYRRISRYCVNSSHAVVLRRPFGGCFSLGTTCPSCVSRSPPRWRGSDLARSNNRQRPAAGGRWDRCSVTPSRWQLAKRAFHTRRRVRADPAISKLKAA